MARKTLRSVSGYLWSQEKIKQMIATAFQINSISFHYSIRKGVTLPDSHKGKSISITWARYSFQREWEWWNKWRRTFPHEHLRVIRSHGTWLRSNPPQLGSVGETRGGFWVQLSVVQADQGRKKSMMVLTFTWKTVRIAAGNVSKFVVGVSSSKLNLRGKTNAL